MENNFALLSLQNCGPDHHSTISYGRQLHLLKKLLIALAGHGSALWAMIVVTRTGGCSQQTERLRQFHNLALPPPMGGGLSRVFNISHAVVSQDLTDATTNGKSKIATCHKNAQEHTKGNNSNSL